MESTSEVVSNTVGDKREELSEPENAQADKQPVEEEQEEVTITIKRPAVEGGSSKSEEAADENKDTEQIEPITVKQQETEEVVEEEEEEEEEEEVEEESDDGGEGDNKEITKEVVETPNSEEIKTTTVTTVKKVTPEGTETIVTTSSVVEETPSAETTTITAAIPASEEETSSTKEVATKPAETDASVVKQEETSEQEKTNAEEDESESAEETEVEDEEDEDEPVSNEKVDGEMKKPNDSLQQQSPNKDQIQPENETHSQLPIKPIKEEAAVEASPVIAQTNQQQNDISTKQENLNNTLKDIISNIDSNIQAQENIAALKERELELLKKQQELAREIEQQRILAQRLATENQYKQQLNNSYVNQNSGIASKAYQPITNVSKYSTFEEKQDNNIYSRKSETYETRESTNVSKKIDLHKIFTPATDAEEILPKNRKLYASSAFYSPTLHPTVEDQVELARRISHSLSDISNQQSRGQSMYVNRKKRSVKWVHEGSGQDYHQYQQQPKTSTSPSILPAYTDAAKHRVQLNLHQEQLLEKYAKPGLKVVQTPWEAALNSGSASAAFVEEQKLPPFPTSTLTPSPIPQIFDASQGGIPIPSASTVTDGYSKSFSSEDYHRYQTLPAAPQQQIQHERQAYLGTNSKRELAYKPSIPQGWKAPSMSLPKDLYMPKEIPLQSYAPPPVTNIPSPVSPYSSSTSYETNQFSAYRPLNASQSEAVSPVAKPYGTSTTFPVSKPYQQGFSSTYGSAQPPKQQYLPPDSYQKVPQNTSQNVPQVSFNPSPLPYDKLAKFENPPADGGFYASSPSTRVSYLNVRGSKVRNTSPAPFAGPDNRSFTPSSNSHYYGGTPSISPRPLSSTHQYSGHNTPNFSHSSVSSNQLLNAPTYNTSARGWGCGSGAASGYHYPQSHLTAAKPQIVNASSMPYTDF